MIVLTKMKEAIFWPQSVLVRRFNFSKNKKCDEDTHLPKTEKTTENMTSQDGSISLEAPQSQGRPPTLKI